jgi:hypothetical protein
VVGAGECGNEILESFLTRSGPGSFSERAVLHGVHFLYLNVKKFEIVMMPL